MGRYIVDIVVEMSNTNQLETIPNENWREILKFTISEQIGSYLLETKQFSPSLTGFSINFFKRYDSNMILPGM